MRLTRALLMCVLAVGWLPACSDDAQAPRDGAVDRTRSDATADRGSDSPRADSQVDGPLVKPDQGADLPTTDGPVADLPKADGSIADAPAPDTLSPDTLSPDTLSPDTLSPDTLSPDTLSPDTLSPDTAPPVPTNGTCANAQALTWVGGKAEATGDTSIFADEHATLVCSGTTAALDGPQAYYKFAAVANQWYRVRLAPEWGAAYLYVFTSGTCAVGDIQTNCTSGGATGDSLDSVSAGHTETLYFRAPATGDVYVGIDSTAPTSAGKFKLTVEDFTAPTNIACEAATALTFASGKVSINGDTSKLFSPNLFGIDVDCGATTDFDGPQVYYRFTAQAATTYRLNLRTTGADNLRFYLFSAASCPATGGVAANIDTDCGSGGVTGAAYNTDIDTGAVGTILFTPATAGDYIVAVDSTDADYFGSFTLEIEAGFTPSSNGTCATATPITLTSGKATINGDTAGVADEYGTGVDCGGSALDGPQVYYELTPAAGKMYKVTVASTFSAYGFWFQKASCGTAATIDADCVGAVTGSRSPFITAGSSEVMYISPQAAPVIIGVDSTDLANAGAFTLQIEEQNAPANGACATAAPITLTGGKATISGSTGGTANEFGIDVDCGTSDLDGPNAYYELVPTAGKAYRVTLKPSFSGYVYWFRKASCPTATAIDADCSSGGSDGGYGGATSTSTSLIITGATGPVIIAVDSTAAYNSGDFVLEVEEVNLQANNACAGAAPITLVSGAATLTGDTSALATNTQNQACAGDTPAPDLFYSLPVTAGSLYEISVTGYNAAVYLLDGCTNTTCLAGSDSTTSTTLPETVLYAAATTGTVIIGVDGYSSTVSTARGAFTLDVKTLVAAPGETCTAAIPMTFAGTQATASGDTTTFRNVTEMSSALSCTSGSTPGKDVFYGVPVTAGLVYRATLTPAAGTDLALYVLPDCTSNPTGSCIAGSDFNFAGTSNFEEVTFVAQTTGTVILAVDGNGTLTSDEGAFTLVVDQLTPAAGDFCSTATPITLTGGTATINGDTSTASNTLQMSNASCLGDAAPGPDVFYSLPVTAGNVYRVEVVPGTGYNTTIYAFTDCAKPIQTCLAGGDASTTTGASGLETMLITPTATGTVLIGVDSDSTTASSNKGTFVLTITEVTAKPAGLVLQEVGVGTPEYVAVKNTGTTAIDLAGVQLFMTDGAYTGTAVDVTFNFPSIMLAAGATLYLPDTTPQAGELDLGTLSYSSASSFVTLLCYGNCTETNAANVLDAALFGTIARALPAGVAFTGGPVGGLTSTTEATTSYVRSATAGSAPSFLASDWTTGPKTRP